MASRAVPRTQIRKPKPTVEQLEQAFEAGENASDQTSASEKDGASLQVVQAPETPAVTTSPEVAVRPSDAVKRSAKKAKAKRSATIQEKVPSTEARRKQTLYLHAEVRKKLKLRAVEDDCEISEIAERALRAFLKA